jgi:hypothetical protein
MSKEKICQCGARTLRAHKDKVANGFYSHSYTGAGKHVRLEETGHKHRKDSEDGK